MKWWYYVASQKGHIAIVKCLVEYGENINKEFEGGNTLLFFACQNRNTAVVKYLVEQGADINKEDNNGFYSFFFMPVEKDAKI